MTLIVTHHSIGLTLVLAHTWWGILAIFIILTLLFLLRYLFTLLQCQLELPIWHTHQLGWLDIEVLAYNNLTSNQIFYVYLE